MEDEAEAEVEEEPVAEAETFEQPAEEPEAEEGEGEGEAEEEEAEEEEGEAEAKEPEAPRDWLAQSSASCSVVLVPDEERQTSQMLQRPEAARVIAVRAAQIARTGRTFTECPGIVDPVERARKELFDHRCPLAIRRVIARTAAGAPVVEQWRVNEMALPPDL